MRDSGPSAWRTAPLSATSSELRECERERARKTASKRERERQTDRQTGQESERNSETVQVKERARQWTERLADCPALRNVQ